MAREGRPDELQGRRSSCGRPPSGSSKLSVSPTSPLAPAAMARSQRRIEASRTERRLEAVMGREKAEKNLGERELIGEIIKTL